MDEKGRRCSIRPALSVPQNPIDRDGIAHRLRVMAESTGIEPVRPEGLDALAPRCLTARPTLRFIGGHGRTQTCVRAHRRRLLYPAEGALDWTRTSIGPFRRRLTVPLVHERVLEAPAGAAPAHSGFADRRVPVSPRGQIGCAHRNRTCLNGFRVRRLTARPARDSHPPVSALVELFTGD
jgi:hypothetical protein